MGTIENPNFRYQGRKTSLYRLVASLFAGEVFAIDTSSFFFFVRFGAVPTFLFVSYTLSRLSVQNVLYIFLIRLSFFYCSPFCGARI